MEGEQIPEINSHLLRMAFENLGRFAAPLNKTAFVPAGDPSMAGGAGGGAPPDPSMGGGAPPPDPSMGGGAPPPDPSMMGGGGAPPGGPGLEEIRAMMRQEMQAGMAGGGAAGAGAGIKPKIDVNVEMLQIKKMLARIVDALGISVPASDMAVTTEDLNQMAAGQQMGGGGGMAGGGGGGMAAPPGGGGGGAPPPGPQGPQPSQQVGGPLKMGSYHEDGRAFDTRGLEDVAQKALAIARIRQRRHAG